MSETVGEILTQDGPAEIWAAAEAAYDETHSKLVILFGSSLRLLSEEHRDEVFSPDWLPERDIVRKTIPVARAYDYAQELFAAWAVKVKRSVPTVHLVNIGSVTAELRTR